MTALLTLERLDDLRNDRHARRSGARDLYDTLLREDFYANNPRDLERTIRAAKREEYVYEHYLEEPMPAHLRSALLLEVRLWISVYDHLGSTVPEEEYAGLCARLRPTVGMLLDVLSLEDEMLTNPLVRHYTALVDRLTAAAFPAR